MLKRRHRALTAEDVTELFEGDHETLSSRYFRLIWKREPAQHSQCVVVLPKKLGLNAVSRNRLKRQILGRVQGLLSEWTPGLRLAILVKTPALKLSRPSFYGELLQLIDTAALQ